MRVLAISYLYPNKVAPHHGIFVHNRIKAVGKYHDVKVINPIPYFPCSHLLARYKEYNSIPTFEKIDGLDVYHPRFFSIPRYFKSLDSYTYSRAVLKIVQELIFNFPFDLIDLHWTYPDLPAGIKLREMYKKKLMVTLRGKEAFHEQDWGWRRKLVNDGLCRVDYAVALSFELKRLALSKGLQENRIGVVRNGVDSDRFFYIPKETARMKIKLSLSGPMIISVGSLIFRKGFDRIISALPEIVKKYPDAVLYIIGSPGPEGNYRKSLEKLITEKNLGNNVFFVGNVRNEHLLYWYNSADLFCLLSRGEGSPNVLTEALACGCPSIATDVGAAKEILDEVGLSVMPNRDTGTVEALRNALAVKYDRKIIANLTGKHDWQWCAGKVNHVYEKVMNE